MKKSNWSYLAGMIDGEGCITVTKGCRYWQSASGEKIKYPAYCLQITIVNNSLALMKFLISHFGGTYYYHVRKNPKAKPGFIWMPKGRKNRENLLLAIIPYLVIKVEQAKLALEFLRMNGEINPIKREEMHQRFQVLNRKGISPETNTQDNSEEELKIESDLIGNYESAPVVIQDAQTPMDEAEAASVERR